MIQTETIYRCTKECPIRKHCFIIKTAMPLASPIVALVKCPAVRKDIRVIIGSSRPP